MEFAKSCNEKFPKTYDTKVLAYNSDNAVRHSQAPKFKSHNIYYIRLTNSFGKSKFAESKLYLS